MERLYKELEKYGKGSHYPFHMPGHKRNFSCVEGSFPIERDITEIEGFDNLHHPEGIIKEAQEAAARLYGVRETFFSINGSTGALLAAISAAVKKDGEILVARNCHKAVYHGICLRNLSPTYIYPHFEDKLGINGGISPSRVERSLEENENIEAVLITSPTYDGVVSDVKAIADIAHRHSIPLIVDEAHGAHLKFSGYFPVSAAELGADVVVQSLHKTLPAMTQTAVLHLCSERVDRERIQRFLGIYQSSSPSYILMASMDACIDKMSREGEGMFREFTALLEETRKRLSKCSCIRLVGKEMLENVKAFDFDRSKLIFSTRGTSLSGRDLHRMLLEKYHLQMEMESESYVLAMSTVGDTREGFERLCEAIEEIDREELFKKTEGKNEDMFKDCLPDMYLKQVMKPGEAMETSMERRLLEESVGKISAEFVYLYPPGIPILVPGELITGHFVRNVKRYMELGLDLQGLSDYTNKTVYVVVQ